MVKFDFFEEEEKIPFKKRKKKEKRKIPTSSFLPHGRVLSISGETAIISFEGKEFRCTLRGLLKKEKTEIKNIIAVGDIVRFSPQEQKIYDVEKRYSVLFRYDQVRKKQQIIATNIDQIFITVSVVSPPLKPFLVDRYIIAAEKGGMQPIILINKIDLFEKSLLNISREKELYDQFLDAFETAGYPILSVSTVSKVGIDALLLLMKKKTSVFSGQSGVGKTSLINLVCKKAFKTGEVIPKTHKGAHITTRAQLIALDGGGFVIDTPGIKSFGLWELTKEEISTHFRDIQKIAKKCQFPNCSHLVEPSCAVKKAVEKKQFSSLRFDSYRNLMHSLKQKTKKR